MGAELTLEDRIRLILDGIDRDELDNDGWWETEKGAEFGKKKLEEVIAVVRENKLTINNKTI